MRIVHEKGDKEPYIELIISEGEFSMMKDYMIISKICFINGEITNVGIKLELGENFDDE